MRPPLDIDALYARHADPLLRWFVRRTADAEVALELWAETFAQALASRRRYRGRSDAEAAGWLYGIAKHQLADYQRRGITERRALQRLRIERPEPSPELLAEIERRAGIDDLRETLATALSSLSDGTRDAVELRIVHELPYPEVAQRLGVQEPAARARVSRGLAALAQIIDHPRISQEATP